MVVDVDISIQFEMFGLPQGKGTGITYRQHPSTFLEWFSKWNKYGRGDACIVTKYPHSLKYYYSSAFSYPIRRPLENIGSSWDICHLSSLWLCSIFFDVRFLISNSLLNHPTTNFTMSDIELTLISSLFNDLFPVHRSMADPGLKITEYSF